MDRISAVTYGTGSPVSFSYYLDGELNAATLGNLGHNLTYNLDKIGNRTSVVDNSVTTTYSPNTINQYSSVTGSSISNGLEHEISAFNGVTYSYINDGRLNSATTGSTTYSMVYDALGRCVKRTLTGGPTTYYIYDGEKPILEYATAAVSVGVNVYGKGIDEILERVAIGSDSNWYTYYPQQNHEGSVNLLTDGSGNVIERYRYDAFGAPTIYTATWGVRANTIYDNRFLFTGREYAATYRSIYNTPAFTFYEYRARAYNPTLGRFMSEDPKLFDAGDYNLFRYCRNDPIDNVDPMGLQDAVATHSPQETSQERQETKSASQAVWERQKTFDRSNGAIKEGWNRIVSGAQQSWKRLNEPPAPGVAAPTIVAVAPVEEAPAALAGLGRLIAKALRASEERTTSTALSAIRVTRPGEAFYRYESANPAFSRITSTGGVTPETFAAPVSDGLVPINMRPSTYNLPNPNILRPVVTTLRPPPGTAVIGPRSVVGGPGHEAMFPFGY
jgi:RHS repeat-associated protein